MIALGVLAVCLPARANADTFSLNCLLASSLVGYNGSCQGISPSQGTITYDNTTGAGTIDLTNAASGEKAFNLYLNLNPGPVGNPTAYDSTLFSFTGAQTSGFDCGQTNKSTACVDNSQKADGDGSGLFDLRLRFDSNSTEPYTFTLLYNGLAIPSLNFGTSDGLLAASHVGGFADGCSEWLGDSPTANGSSGNSGLCGGTSVPEPASMLLFGLGAIGVAARMRRQFSL
jgi:hypothetical protein